MSAGAAVYEEDLTGAGGSASKLTWLLAGDLSFRQMNLSIGQLPIWLSPEREVRERERALERTPTHAFPELVFKSHTFTAVTFYSILF